MSHALSRLRIRSLVAVSPRRTRSRLRAAAMILGALALLVIPKPVTAVGRIGAIELESGEDNLDSAVIDPAGAFAYFGTDTSPGRVVKINLASFERVGVLELESNEGLLRAAGIDPDGQFAYFGTSGGQVVKIDLGTLQRVGALDLGTSRSVQAAVIDPNGAFAYFGTSGVPAQVVKVDLEKFEVTATIGLADGENSIQSAVIDPDGTFAYFGTSTAPGQVVKINLTSLERVDAIELGTGENFLKSAVIDPDGAFAYFGTGTTPGHVIKIDLTSFVLAAAIDLDSGEGSLESAVIDPAGAFAYFGMFTVPGRVVEIDLGTFEPVDAIGLENGEDSLFSAVIDPDGAFAYFGTETEPGRVVKIGRLPELAFDPASLEFGDVEVGSTSPPQIATLSNDGDADATGLEFGPPGNGFEADTSACNDTLPPGDSCEVSVTFTPTETGPASAVLTVESDEEITAELELAGNGIGETEVFTPIALAADPEPLMTLSDGNAVFEPGERVLVAPAWRNDGMFSQLLTGTASGFSGPAGPTYTLVDGDADYGMVEPQAIAGCLDLEDCYAMEITPAGAPRPAPHWDAAFDETLSDESVKTWTLHVGDSFEDVPRASPFYRAIETLLHSGVSSEPGLARRDLLVVGCGEGQFCPAEPHTRAQAAVFLLKAARPDLTPPPCVEGDTRFADVPFDSPFCPWIEELASREITAGCGNGNYCPGAPVSRGQMAVLLLKASQGVGYTPPECTDELTDVLCPSPFADWIEDLLIRGITAGCATSPLRYCPAEPVARQQMAVFVTRAFELVLYGP